RFSMKRPVLALTALLFAAPAFAQAPQPVTGVGTAKDVWQMMSGYVIQSAEMMPEADYSFKPAPTVRSFGQMLGHVAGAEYMFCAAAIGEAPKAEDDIEKTVTSKAGLVAALKAAAEYCNKAYAMTDVEATGMTKLFGGDQSKYFALILNASHVGEHYGNLVTYLRIKNMVPPSSAPRAGGM
ncbi:MAG: DinB family protein, partial [Gemmatimonadaceae bacterium]